MTWVISRILPYTLATCIHSGLRMHTPGVTRVLTQGLSYIGCLHCYLRSVLFVDGHPNQSNLYLRNSAILNLHNPSKKPTGFFFPKKAFKGTPFTGNPLVGPQLPVGFPGPQWLQDHLQPRLVPWQQHRKHPGNHCWCWEKWDVC